MASLSACGALEPSPVAKAGAAQPSVSVSTEGVVDMTAWTVPAGAHGAHLQVRLVPHKAIAQAVLRVRAQGLQVSPSQFVLKDLRPAESSQPDNSPPNPPALGMTVLRTFRLTAASAGAYRATLELEFDDRRVTTALQFTLH